MKIKFSIIKGRKFNCWKMDWIKGIFLFHVCGRRKTSYYKIKYN